jgi:hypothetical protein
MAGMHAKSNADYFWCALSSAIEFFGSIHADFLFFIIFSLLNPTSYSVAHAPVCLLLSVLLFILENVQFSFLFGKIRHNLRFRFGVHKRQMCIWSKSLAVGNCNGNVCWVDENILDNKSHFQCSVYEI